MLEVLPRGDGIDDCFFSISNLSSGTLSMSFFFRSDLSKQSWGEIPILIMTALISRIGAWSRSNFIRSSRFWGRFSLRISAVLIRFCSSFRCSSSSRFFFSASSFFVLSSLSDISLHVKITRYRLCNHLSPLLKIYLLILSSYSRRSFSSLSEMSLCTFCASCSARFSASFSLTLLSMNSFSVSFRCPLLGMHKK